MGQVVILMGEAGIGKSRLLQRLDDALTDDALLRLECRCSPYYQHTALYPVLEMLRQILQDDTAASPEERLKASPFNMVTVAQ
jgi:ABC-type lipoprotein export system ATPase subunit